MLKLQAVSHGSWLQDTLKVIATNAHHEFQRPLRLRSKLSGRIRNYSPCHSFLALARCSEIMVPKPEPHYPYLAAGHCYLIVIIFLMHTSIRWYQGIYLSAKYWACSGQYIGNYIVT